MHFQENTLLDKEAQAARARENAAKATAAREVCGGILQPVKSEIHNYGMGVKTARDLIKAQ